jgi:hypothetical protein
MFATNFKLVNNKKPVSNIDGGEYNRGILQVSIPELVVASSIGGDLDGDQQHPNVPPRQRMRVVMYGSIDTSGSMGEYAIAGNHNISSTGPRTKMDFVHATLINMVDYIIEQNIDFPHVDFYLALVKFHSRATCVLFPTRVTSQNRDALIQTISAILPTGGTNFMKCFTEMSNLIANESIHIPNDDGIPEEFVHRIHLFLTDGSNNEGDKSVPALTNALKIQYRENRENRENVDTGLSVIKKQPTQIMVGYGTDHDSIALSNLCAQFPDSKQWFIDDIEKTGCIFGEILWSAVNAAYTGVKLVSNAEFYDFATMRWTKEMSLGDFAYESSRTFYARIPWSVESVECKFTYTSMENLADKSRDYIAQIQYVSDETEPATIDAEVEKELWRLDTIMAIDESLKFFRSMRTMPHQSCLDEKERLILDVTSFQEKFLAYATEKQLTEDPFIIQLADDLFVCINGLMAMSIGERYVAARQASQIQQRAVTINDITPLQSEIIHSMPSMPSMPYHQAPSDDLYGNYQHHHQYDDDMPYASNRHYQVTTPPPAPRSRRANDGSAHVCVDDDTQPSRAHTTMNHESPKTPMGKISMDNDIDASADATAAAATIAADDKIVSDLTPSARGVGSKLRHLSREAILGMYHRNAHGGYNEDFDGGNYSCGGGASDDTFSSHASPACARIGRMLSAQSQPHSAPDRTPTAPF